jgi:hypothetical protein
MLFIENKYTRWYFSIINRRNSEKLTTRKLAKSALGYVENHHIIPSSLNGTNEKNNMVFLTAKEHFVCHHLLTKMCISAEDSSKMRFALHKMCTSSGNQARIKITARLFEKIRKDFAIDMSNLLKGKTKGPLSQEHRDSISKSSKGHKKSDETRNRMCGPKPARIKHLAKLNASKKGIPLSEQRKENMRKPKKEGTSLVLSKLRKGFVSAYDLIDKKIKRVTIEEFENQRNIRYVGQKSKLRYEKNA